MNSGKIFEADIKDSVKNNKDYFIYRFRDNAASFSGGTNVRFASSNICDFLAMTLNNLFLLELKTHAGTSIPFKCIRKNQIDDMSKINHKKVKPYFILNYRDINRTFAIEAKELKEFMTSSDRKSIPLKWCEENGIEIAGTKKISRYKYSLDKFFELINCD